MKFITTILILLASAAPLARAQTGNGDPVQTLALSAKQLLSDPDRDYVYVTLNGTNTLAVIDSTTLEVVKKISIGSVPYGMAITKDGTKLYVALSGATKIAVVDLTTLTALPSLTIAGNPYFIAAGLDNRLYVSTTKSPFGLLQIDATTGATETTLPGQSSLGFLQISPDKKTLYYGDDGLSPSTLERWDVSTATPVLQQTSPFNTAGENGEDLVLSHNGSLLCFPNGAGNIGSYMTAVFDPADFTNIYGSFDVGPYPGPLAFSPDDTTIYEQRDSAGQILVFSPATFVQVAALNVTDTSIFPNDLVTSRTGRYLFYADDTNILIYDLLAAPAPASLLAHTGESVSYQPPIYIGGNGTITGLPAGLTFDEVTRTISGKPTKTGTFDVVITVNNGTNTITFNLTLVVYPDSRAANISTRAQILTGEDVAIAGFIVEGQEPKMVIIRGIGPSLELTGELADPMITLYDSTGTEIASDDDWAGDYNSYVLTNIGLEPSNPRESALYRTLNPGAYTVMLSGASNSTGLGLIEVYDADAAVDGLPLDYSRLANISTRGSVGGGDDVMIAGAILAGPDSAAILVRGIGPSLSKAGVGSPLADPYLELHDSDGMTIASNDNWQDTQKTLIEATGIAPTDPTESAIDITLQPGAYTAILSGVGRDTGVGLVEVYNLP